MNGIAFLLFQIAEQTMDELNLLSASEHEEIKVEDQPASVVADEF